MFLMVKLQSLKKEIHYCILQSNRYLIKYYDIQKKIDLNQKNNFLLIYYNINKLKRYILYVNI